MSFSLLNLIIVLNKQQRLTLHTKMMAIFFFLSYGFIIVFKTGTTKICEPAYLHFIVLTIIFADLALEHAW